MTTKLPKKYNSLWPWFHLHYNVKLNILGNAQPSTNKTPFDCFNFQKADWEKVRLALAESDLEEIVKSAKTLDQALELPVNELIASLKKSWSTWKETSP